jgi:uncharacterized protein (DUF2141 family)
MKTQKTKIQIILMGILIAAATLLTYGQELKITIKNVKGENGMILLALYDSESQFMKKEIKNLQANILNGEAVAIFKDVAPGTYAISVMHDTNDNKELDSNLFGIPKEGFGFSNDAMGMFGPPDFKKASFEHDGKKEMVINLKYM